MHDLLRGCRCRRQLDSRIRRGDVYRHFWSFLYVHMWLSVYHHCRGYLCLAGVCVSVCCHQQGVLGGWGVLEKEQQMRKKERGEEGWCVKAFNFT